MRLFLTSLLVLCALCGRAGVFDGVGALAAADRMARVQDIYNKEVRYKDSVTAIRSLNELTSIADKLQDKPLQCLAVSLLADQYARTRGINPLSTKLHNDAIKMAERFRLPLMVGLCTHRLGRYYYNFKNYPFAFEYMLRADNIFRELGYDEVPDIAEILFFVGSTYYEMGDYERAESFLQNVQKQKKIGKYVQKQSLNTLALIHRQQGDTVNALLYFEKTLAASVKQDDPVWMGISYSNIASIYFHQGRFAEAYPLLRTSTQLSLTHKQYPDAYGNLLLMARIEILQNRLQQAQQKIDSAIALQQYVNTPIARKQLYEAEVLLYEKTNRQAKALEAQRKLLLVKDSLSISKDQQAYQKILLRMETERHLNDIDKLEADARSSAIKRNAVIVVLALLVLVLLLLYNRNRLKARTDAAALQAEKLRAEEQLKNARQLLQNFTENTRQKNELIEKFSAELQRLKGNLTGDPLYEERLKNFDRLVHSTILTDTEWNSFRELFDKVHKDFFTRLEQKLPGLSLNDTRLISLVKLSLNNREMARMMGMDENAIAEAKQRLREKIHPGQDGLGLEDLVQAI
ncbi:tetratricopeptide repeat protein [Sediminibacterium roseum]|uniref:Tetratricopeptide repeat protein n=1 Tax=Sediminibacterium roseum TaxID=1978412 RepID=A0ABW9ZMG1_9BACT|nr:tetratricopeptide repeat protein [Sediminibacterium roseum]NCI48286.1 tetratricopeptide repeat protein [Sediminibacterium roseum]